MLCKHYAAACNADFVNMERDERSIDGFYARGVYIVATVCDGDCGLDCVLRMTEEVSTRETRALLRQD
eukprot:8860670-Pyramimonas_sp.AAC.1